VEIKKESKIVPSSVLTAHPVSVACREDIAFDADADGQFRLC